MLRFISLVKVHEGTDVQPIVAAGATMCAADDNIISGQVSAGLGLMAAYGAPEASYTMLLDFADQQAMDAWATGQAHADFGTVVGSAVETFMVTQFDISDSPATATS